MSIESIEILTQRSFSTLAILTNSLLLHLIINKSSSQLGTYKYLMIYIAFFEVLYAIIELLLVPKVLTNNSGFLILAVPERSPLPIGFLPYLNLIFCAAFGTTTALFAMHFLFRYLVVSRDSTFTTLTPFTFLFWLSTPLIIGSMWAAVYHFFCGSDQNTLKFLIQNSENTANVSFTGAYFYPIDSNGNMFINWKNMIGIMLISILLSSSCSVMIYFGLKCYRRIVHLTELSIHSKEFRVYQMQLFLALVLQTIIPALLMHLPCMLIALTCLLNSSSQFFGRLLVISISSYLAIDPLPTMFVISDYRKVITGWLPASSRSRPALIIVKTSLRMFQHSD